MWRKEKAQLIGEINQLSMTVVGDFYFGKNTKTDPQKQNQFHAEEEEEAKPNSRCNILWERTLVVLSLGQKHRCLTIFEDHSYASVGLMLIIEKYKHKYEFKRTTPKIESMHLSMLLLQGCQW